MVNPMHLLRCCSSCHLMHFPAPLPRSPVLLPLTCPRCVIPVEPIYMTFYSIVLWQIVFVSLRVCIAVQLFSSVCHHGLLLWFEGFGFLFAPCLLLFALMVWLCMTLVFEVKTLLLWILLCFPWVSLHLSVTFSIRVVSLWICPVEQSFLVVVISRSYPLSYQTEFSPGVVDVHFFLVLLTVSLLYMR